MPELAEVEFYRKQWLPAIGERVRKVHLHPGARIFRETDPARLASTLEGRRFLKAEAHGKQLCFRFSENLWLGLHLGMSGKLASAEPEMVPARHDHLVLVMPHAALVFSDYRKFGRVRFHEGASPPDWWSDLPPQPHEPAFDRPRLEAIIRHHPRKRLKGLLLDQDAFPGIGNWMADEILWRARIHPATKAGSLPATKRRRLFEETRAVAQQSLELIGNDWSTPPDSWLFPHRWKRGDLCPVSGKPLQHETICGRTTCFSPAIQKEIH
ncbi:MAG: DNA-formamidopyrimidine glycosylase family protein [Oceanipulchritudo sp.]